jgi:hypothetical protein
MVARPDIKTFACVVFFLLLATGALAACGGSSSTASSSSSSGSSATNSGGTSASTSGTPAPGKRPDRVAGTITQYNASANTLTIKESDGTTATFSTGKARILKSQKITQQQLSSLLSNSGTIVMVMGQQAGTNTYTAQTVVVPDRTNGNGGAPQGVLPKSTPPAGAPQGGAQPNGTPPAGGNRGITIQNGKLQNNQLVGKDRRGQTITVNLSSTTTILQQVTATVSDLQTGQTVTILGAPAQSGGTVDARQILIGDSSAM